MLREFYRLPWRGKAKKLRWLPALAKSSIGLGPFSNPGKTLIPRLPLPTLPQFNLKFWDSLDFTLDNHERIWCYNLRPQTETHPINEADYPIQSMRAILVA
ncbi:MAG: hypothetical protein R2867_38520 [Caldilineaceae bacterium]